MKTIHKTKKSLAAALEISFPTLNKYLTITGAPECGPDGYDLKEVADFIARHCERDVTALKTDNSFKALRGRELQLKCDRLALRLQKERGEVIEKVVIAAAIRRALGGLSELIERKIVMEWPTVVAGLNPDEARVYARRLYDQVMVAAQELGKEFPE